MSQIINRLRKKHPRFYYHDYSVNQTSNSLIFCFHFEIESGIHFSPNVIINNVDHYRIKAIGKDVINNMAFHLGLMEIPSYWKAVCSPEIVIKAGALDNFQISWWQNLLHKGLGEFFYKNNIDNTTPNFVNYKTNCSPCAGLALYEGQLDSEKLLVPIGGGKDSAVSCELLKKANRQIVCWRLNPATSVLEHIRSTHNAKPITVTRVIDKALLQLDKNGYLNGHTPFSAYLAFATVMCAILFDHKDIAISNERSSNEGNVEYRGVEINHQYSKSFDFEKKFRTYSTGYLAKNINYFSLLRPLNELQIARIFSGLDHHFSYFSSCNKIEKEGRWCHKCYKCLFVFTILYPFVEEKTLVTKIFTKNLFEDKTLTKAAFDLLGTGAAKPFECVGSKEETIVAFYLCIKKTRTNEKSLPVVLQAVGNKIFTEEQNMESRAKTVMTSWDNHHALPNDLEVVIRKAMD